jgi:hypothetical protein
MPKTWKPKYPVKELPHNLWEKFPEWGIQKDNPHALRHALESLDKINDWQVSMIQDLVALYDYLEKERKESNGEVPVKACYVYQEQLIELFLGCSIRTTKRFLREMGLEKKPKEKVKP